MATHFSILPWEIPRTEERDRLQSMLSSQLSMHTVSSIAQLCLTLWNPMDYSTPGFPVHLRLPELAQTHVHRAGDAIQPSHHLSFLSPPAFNLSQLQGLFQWVNSLYQVAKVLELQLQYQIEHAPTSLRSDWASTYIISNFSFGLLVAMNPFPFNVIMSKLTLSPYLNTYSFFFPPRWDEQREWEVGERTTALELEDLGWSLGLSLIR